MLGSKRREQPRPEELVFVPKIQAIKALPRLCQGFGRLRIVGREDVFGCIGQSRTPGASPEGRVPYGMRRTGSASPPDLRDESKTWVIAPRVSQ
jgi:hypothetical protein